MSDMTYLQCPSFDDYITKFHYLVVNKFYIYSVYYFFWQYLNDVEELENWINDKMALATSKDYGKDENSADKLLTKNKVGTLK